MSRAAGASAIGARVVARRHRAVDVAVGVIAIVRIARVGARRASLWASRRRRRARRVDARVAARSRRCAGAVDATRGDAARAADSVSFNSYV